MAKPPRYPLHQGPRMGPHSRRHRHRRHHRPRPGTARRRGVRRAAGDRPRRRRPTRPAPWSRASRPRPTSTRRSPARWSRSTRPSSTTPRSSTATPRAKAGSSASRLDDTDAFDALMDAAAYDEYPGDTRLMDVLAELAALEAADGFVSRHIGPSEAEIAAMLHAVGAATLDELAAKTVPAAIRTQPGARPAAADRRGGGDRASCAGWRRRTALQKSLIGMGYHGTHHAAGDPAQRAGESRLVHRLHALPGRDRAGPAGGAAQLPDDDHRPHRHGDRQRLAARRGHRRRRGDGDGARASARPSPTCWRSPTDLHPQTRAVLATRAQPLGIGWSMSRPAISAAIGAAQPFALVLQYPGTTGAIRDLSPEIGAAHEAGALVIVAADLLALALLTPPGEMGADIVVGSAQRFGVPMGFGGPHAGVLRHPRRLQAAHAGPARRRLARRRRPAGDAPGAADARAAHPPREGDIEHLHRAGAAGGDGRLYAVWHGPEGLRRIARRVQPAGAAAGRRGAAGAAIASCTMRFFDTIAIETGSAPMR